MTGSLADACSGTSARDRDTAGRCPLPALSPQCGFSRSVHGNEIATESQATKLERVLKTAREVRGTA